VPARVGALLEERKLLERELSEARRQLAMGGGGGSAAAAPRDIGGVAVLTQKLEGLPAKDLRGLIDDAKAKLGSGVVAFVAVNDGKAAVAVGVTSDLVARLSAVDLVRVGSAALGGGGGGGRPDMAQAGGPDGDKADAALQAIEEAVAGFVGAA
jgi:alanyl-tRNA synthetase